MRGAPGEESVSAKHETTCRMRERADQVSSQEVDFMTASDAFVASIDHRHSNDLGEGMPTSKRTLFGLVRLD